MKYESPQTPIYSGVGSVIDTSKIFRVGDIVKTVPHPLFGVKSYTGKIDTIVDIDDRADAMYPYKLKKLNMWIHPNELEHYVEEVKDMEEKELGKEDNFPTKELNLCELLKGCEGEKFYSLIDGEVKLKQLTDDVICQYHKYHRCGYLSGCSLDGVCQLYPSRALYEKYPLDAYSAWQEWEESRKPRYKFEVYLSGYNNGVMMADIAVKEQFQFKTYEEIIQAAEAVRETLMKIQENNSVK